MFFDSIHSSNNSSRNTGIIAIISSKGYIWVILNILTKFLQDLVTAESRIWLHKKVQLCKHIQLTMYQKTFKLFNKIMERLLGNGCKMYGGKWEISEPQKLTEKELATIEAVEVVTSEEYGRMQFCFHTVNGQVFYHPVLRSKEEKYDVGDFIDPKSVRLVQLSRGKEVIEKAHAYGEVLKSDDDE